jgi:hypothetical protein
MNEIIMDPPRPKNDKPKADNSTPATNKTVKKSNKTTDSSPSQTSNTNFSGGQTPKSDKSGKHKKSKINSKKNPSKRKPRKRKKKKSRGPLLNLLIIATIAMLGYKGYKWLDNEFKKQQDHINENFSDSVDLMLEEYEKDNYVRGLHDIKDPFEGWEHYSFHSLKLRYPPELSPEYEYIQKPSCAYASDSVDFTSEEYRSLYGGARVSGTEQQKFGFYANSIGFTLCYFPNTQKLDLIRFVNHPKTWLPDTDKYNGKIQRSIIIKNWNKANVERNSIEGYFYEEEIKDGGYSRIIFLQDISSKEIYIVDLDEKFLDPKAKSTEKMEDLFNRIITSFR